MKSDLNTLVTYFRIEQVVNMSEKTIRKMIRTLNQLGYVIITPDQQNEANEIYRNDGNIFLGELSGILDFIQCDEEEARIIFANE